jgi:hypothetical protein
MFYNKGGVRLAESRLKLADFVREKHCLAGSINNKMSGQPAGWSENFRPANKSKKDAASWSNCEQQK